MSKSMIIVLDTKMHCIKDVCEISESSVVLLAKYFHF